jgi:hypothetical protein
VPRCAHLPGKALHASLGGPEQDEVSQWGPRSERLATFATTNTIYKQLSMTSNCIEAHSRCHSWTITGKSKFKLIF